MVSVEARASSPPIAVFFWKANAFHPAMRRLSHLAVVNWISSHLASRVAVAYRGRGSK